METQSKANLVLSSITEAHEAFLRLEKFKGPKRSAAVLEMANAVKASANEILEANTLDLETSREMAVPDLILNWVKLTPERLQTTIEVLNRLAQLSDPLQRIMNTSYQLNPAQTYRQLMPLGVIALIYQGFPQLGAIAAAMAIKTGNSLILRGSGDASHTNQIFGEVLKNALQKTGLPKECLQVLFPDSGTFQDLLTQDKYINLIIPYGRPSFIQQVTQLATAPVLKTAMGNCYLYWAPSGDLDLVRSIIIDSHSSQPDPVNGIEKVLISSFHKSTSLLRLFNSLKEKDFKLKGDQQLVQEFPEHLTGCGEAEWSTPYLTKTVAFKVVESLDRGIAWMNQYSSGHANCLVTESYQETRQFEIEIDSALVYINCSSRFYRNPKGAESVFLGVSNQKGIRRGLIGLETFTTYKQVVRGEANFD